MKIEITYQMLLDAVKAALGGKFIVINAYIKEFQRPNKQPNFTP